MIASLRGHITALGDDFAVIVVGGVGLKVFAPHSTREKLTLNHEAFVYTQLIVREDALTLYGFATEGERDLFNVLNTVNGVGPRMALSILSTLSVDSLRSAILAERADVLTRVPGVGKKTAQKIALELKDKLGAGLDAAPILGFEDVNADVLDTLVALGYSIVEAQRAIQSLPPDAPKNVEDRVRLALQFFV